MSSLVNLLIYLVPADLIKEGTVRNERVRSTISVEHDFSFTSCLVGRQCTKIWTLKSADGRSNFSNQQRPCQH